MYQEWRRFQPSSNRARQSSGASLERGIRPQGQNPPERLPNLTFAGIFLLGGSMSSHDSFAASGSSPTVDFVCECHGNPLITPTQELP
jgi:hypothetical protein